MAARRQGSPVTADVRIVALCQVGTRSTLIARCGFTPPRLGQVLVAASAGGGLCRGMQDRAEAAAEGRDRRRWCDHMHRLADRAQHRFSPPVEGEHHRALTQHESGPVGRGDDTSVGQVVDRRLPQPAVATPLEATPAAQALRCEAPIQLVGADRRGPPQRGCDAVAVRAMITETAEPTRSMPRRERDGIVEEEQRGPPSRPVELVTPAAERGDADDPEVSPMVTNELTVVVDEAAAVAREQSTAGGGVEVAPRIDTVAAWHLRSMGRFAPHAW